MIPGKAKEPIAADIFTRAMTSMKNLLKQAEDRYDGDTECDGYRWQKGYIMDQFYPMLEDIYRILEENCVVKECTCGASIKKRNGWKPCRNCAGSGYRNSDHLNNFIYEMEKLGLIK